MEEDLSYNYDTGYWLRWLGEQIGNANITDNMWLNILGASNQFQARQKAMLYFHRQMDDQEEYRDCLFCGFNDAQPPNSVVIPNYNIIPTIDIEMAIQPDISRYPLPLEFAFLLT